MIREEQLQQKVTDLWINGADLSYANAFKDGAVWADTNPNWHKCSDELPEPNVPVLVLANADTESFQFVGYYDDDDECWRADIDDQTIEVATDYWMELPQPPKID